MSTSQSDRAACQPIEDVIIEWPDKPQWLARQLVDRYGLPDEVLPSMLIWRRAKPWKRMILHHDEIPHEFPFPHTDLLEQAISYRVPVDKYSDLAAFNGSVHADRTRGELAASCGNESLNILALNLAHDIISGTKSVDEARAAYADNAAMIQLDRPTAYTSALRFPPHRGNAADQDISTMR